MRPTDWNEVFGFADPTPGDPYEIRAIALKWGGVADDAEYAETKLRGLFADEAVRTWIGKAGEAFASHSNELPDQLGKAKDSYRQASEAMTWWAGRLTTHQSSADGALVRGRQAKHDLESAQSALAAANASVSAAGGASALHYTGAADDPKAPTTAQVDAAQNKLHSAQAAQTNAQHLVDDAQGRLDLARQMAEEARHLRESDGRTTAGKIHDAADAGIKPRGFWEKLGDNLAAAWHVLVEVAKVVVAVLGVVALIIGGPLAWIVFAAALVILADTLMKYAKGEASLLDVGLALLGCIPGTKGLTTLSELSAAFKAGGALGALAHLGGAAKTAVVGLAQAVRQGGSTVVTTLRQLTASGLTALTLRLGRPVEMGAEGARALTSIHAPNMYLDGGLNVGALHLPTEGPVADLLQGYDRFGGQTADDFARTWGDGAGGYDWTKVPNDGFAGDRVPMQMNPGEVLDRFGPPDGRYLSPDGTPFAERAIPPSNLDGASPNFGYHRYEVLKPFDADVGYVAPAMGQDGGGIQVFVNGEHITDAGPGARVNTQWLIDHGYLRELV